MSRIPALDEITEQLGAPAAIRWVNGPNGTKAAIARFRHQGGAIHFSGCGSFRLIFHISDSDVETQEGAAQTQRRTPHIGSIATEFTRQRSRIAVHKAADTLHLLFSPELASRFRHMATGNISAEATATLRSASMQALAGMHAPTADTSLDRVLSLVMQTMTPIITSSPRTGGGLSPQASRTTRALLSEHLHSGVSVEDLARAAGLSVHHFIKACKQSQGLTPHALLQEMRMQHAIALLTKADTLIDEVAFATGFCSPSHFIGTFRRATGITPATFRDAVAA